MTDSDTEATTDETADETTDAMLRGYRVLDLSQYLAGAGVTRFLAELGPEIIKVEIPPLGDPARLLPWVVDDRSTFFVQNNRGKQSLCLDWNQPEGLRSSRSWWPGATSWSRTSATGCCRNGGSTTNRSARSIPGS